jgi:L-seryl-tRNA(Ser) seleniumtransferase
MKYPIPSENQSSLYQRLPSLNDLLLSSSFAPLLETHPRGLIVSAARAVLAQLKQEIREGRHTEASLEREIDQMPAAVGHHIARLAGYRLRKVINATGVILHTNLGRAPLSDSAIAHIIETASGYSNLELDLESGERSRRDVLVEELLLRVLGEQGDGAAARSAIVVNNCAAATFLTLNTLAEGGEVIVSRGELVEIGGGFRIPEILAKSGAILREVGTTNRTRLADYERAISPATRLILRVHQSNFSMQGFVERAELGDIVSLSKRFNIPVFHDQGTGLIGSLEFIGVGAEPTLPGSLREGCDLVAASGDKLLGGPQCGLLVGRRELVQSVRKNPLFRTYRVDKMTYAALEATLMDYASEGESRLPVQRMLKAEASEILARCEWISHQLNGRDLRTEAVPVESMVGGGTAPSARLQSAAVALSHALLQPQQLLLALRRLEPPVIGRIYRDSVLLDLRTVEPEFDQTLALLLGQIASGAATSGL